MYLQPFDKHPADVAALRQCASELLARSVEAADNAQATRQAYQPAIANWDGMGAAEMVSAAEPVQGEAQALGRDLAWGR